MTKEAFAIAQAFRERKKCTKHRTMTDGDNVYLFGKRIAWRDDNGAVWMSMCGWPTVTTRDRLNAICDVYGRGRPFYQRKHEQFYGELPIESHDKLPLCGPLGMMAIEAEYRLRRAA